MSIKRFTTAIAAAALLGTGLATAPIGAAPAAHAVDVDDCAHQTMFTIYTHDNTARLMRYDNTKPSAQQTWTSSKSFGDDTHWLGLKKLTVDNSQGQRRLLAIKEGGADNGTLYAYTFNQNNPDELSNPVKVGNGFTDVRLMTSSDGALYTIDHAGYLHRYAYDKKTHYYAGGGVVGHGWNNMTAIAGGRLGAIYASSSDGKLHWYQDNSFTGGAGFDHAVISQRWNGISQMTGGGNGILYGFAPTQTQLIRYTFSGDDTGQGTFAQAPLGSYYHHVEFAADPTACGSPKPKPQVPTQPQATKGDLAVGYAKQHLIGRPYRYATQGPVYFDCSGLVAEAWTKGGGVPVYHQNEVFFQRFYNAKNVITPQTARPGDILLYGDDSDLVHSALYVGNGRVIQAYREGIPSGYDNADWDVYAIVRPA